MEGDERERAQWVLDEDVVLPEFEICSGFSNIVLLFDVKLIKRKREARLKGMLLWREFLLVRLNLLMLRIFRDHDRAVLHRESKLNPYEMDNLY